MIDIAKKVKEALTKAKGQVQYAYPQDKVEVPMLTYFEADNASLQRADDEELTALVSYHVDVWAKTPEEAHEMSRKVNEVLMEMGFIRRGTQDLYEKETNIHHRAMQFEIIVSE